MSERRLVPIAAAALLLPLLAMGLSLAQEAASQEGNESANDTNETGTNASNESDNDSDDNESFFPPIFDDENETDENESSNNDSDDNTSAGNESDGNATFDGNESDGTEGNESFTGNETNDSSQNESFFDNSTSANATANETDDNGTFPNGTSPPTAFDNASTVESNQTRATTAPPPAPPVNATDELPGHLGDQCHPVGSTYTLEMHHVRVRVNERTPGIEDLGVFSANALIISAARLPCSEVTVVDLRDGRLRIESADARILINDARDVVAHFTAGAGGPIEIVPAAGVTVRPTEVHNGESTFVLDAGNGQGLVLVGRELSLSLATNTLSVHGQAQLRGTGGATVDEVLGGATRFSVDESAFPPEGLNASAPEQTASQGEDTAESPGPALLALLAALGAAAALARARRSK